MAAAKEEKPVLPKEEEKPTEANKAVGIDEEDEFEEFEEADWEVKPDDTQKWDEDWDDAGWDDEDQDDSFQKKLKEELAKVAK
mmetsp:Transcript_26764/g.58200  ORF Transcript_26764/g.58200 Transcript_26764/m.58200 type:complete len:83 (-) Transcript_26764:109-357(-)